MSATRPSLRQGLVVMALLLIAAPGAYFSSALAQGWGGATPIPSGSIRGYLKPGGSTPSPYNWGPDVVDPPPSSAAITYCTSSVSPTALNSIFYRGSSAGPGINIVDNSRSISTSTTIGGNAARILVAASDQGGYFAYYAPPNAGVPGVYITPDSGQNWHFVYNATISRQSQMVFGANGHLYVFYFLGNGNLNLLEVTPTTTGNLFAYQISTVVDHSQHLSHFPFICDYDFCRVEATRTYNHVVAVFNPGEEFTDGFGSPYDYPSYVTINTSVPGSLPVVGSIGSDLSGPSPCSYTNDHRIHLSTDGTRLYVAKPTCSGGNLSWGVSEIGGVDASGYLVDNNATCNPFGSASPFTNLDCPNTVDIGYMMPTTWPQGWGVEDRIRYFAARYRTPGYPGAAEVDLIPWTNDGFGLPDLDTIYKVRVRPNNTINPITAGPMEDITSNNLPAGSTQLMTDGQGGTGGLSSVMNATVASYCKVVTNGSSTSYFMTDTK